jgi:hypothetical protein
MTIDKAKLKEIAKATDDPENEQAWDQFMEATSPQAILALLAEIERLEREVDQAKADGADAFGLAQCRADTIDQLKAENAALRSTCAGASACMDRWAGGHAFDPDGPGGRIRDELYDAYRPGAREGLAKLQALMSKEADHD